MLPKQPNKSLIDGLRCLQGLVSGKGPVGMSELAKQLDIESTRVHRLLRCLTHMGYARQNRSRKYIPGPAIYPLTAQMLYASHFMSDAIQPLQDLRKKVPYIVAMGVLWERRVSYLFHARNHTPLEKAIGMNGFWDATDSGIGMAVLSRHSSETVRGWYGNHEIPGYPGGIDALLHELEAIRETGYAYVQTHGKEHNQTLALHAESNPYLGVGVSGQIAKEEIPELIKSIKLTVECIDKSSSDQESNRLDIVDTLRSGV